MICPEFLDQGDSIALVAPARKVSKKEVQYAIDRIASEGYKVVETPNLYASQNQFAGTDKQRADDLLWALRNKDIKAILCARGGYGTIRTLSHIEYKDLASNPKWIIGYSDITVFHSMLNRVGIMSLHATMPLSFPENTEDSIKYLFNFISGNIPANYIFDGDKLNVEGVVEGELIGGNLSVLYSVRGTKYEQDYSNKILFIEDLDEYLYHIDRMMMNFSESGILSNLSGVIVGDMIDMHDNSIPFGKNAKEIIYSHLKSLKIPVAFISGIGHGKRNLPLLLGSKIKLKTTLSKTEIYFSL